ncbi:MAG: uroporphyrinogen-III C-methyltransferase [Cyanophyceae cyanobacterium]
MRTSAGKVYLVGAGPGNIAYLTVRGQQLLQTADVVIYDALVEPSLLQLVPAHCLKIDVGKRGGRSSTPQPHINQLLVAYCSQGDQVVRLKSGDPLIFGRSTPEIRALEAAGCAFALVPGISSALAAPLLAGIPLTDKELSRCFAVMSAHEPDALDWAALSRIDTLVLLMGGRGLAVVVERLLQHGRSPQEPIAIVRHCARPDQQTWRGSLATILEQTAGQPLSPAAIIIGKVVDSHFQADALTLAGLTVLVTRASEQSGQFTHLLQQQGATVIEMPALEITPPSSWAELDGAITSLAQFHWLLLTSANGVHAFFERLATLGKDARALAGVNIAVVGKKTAAVLEQYGVRPDFVPPEFVADSLVANFPAPLAQQKLLFPRVETGGREVLVSELSAQGASVVEVAAYQSQCPAHIAPEAWQALQQRAVDIVTFASSKTVRNFRQLVERAIAPQSASIEALLQGVCIASIGPQTSKSCRQLLGRVDVEAREYTLAGLIKALGDWTAAEKLKS